MKKLFLLALLAAASVAANATVLTGSILESDLIPIPGSLNYGGGPVVNGNETWTSTNLFNNGGTVFGYTAGYGFGSNGYWDSSVGPMVGVNDSFSDYGATDTVTVAFTNPVFAVGDLFNYVPGGSTPTTLAVYDSSWTLIESLDLNFSTGGTNDSGEWLGFSETTPISYFTMSDNYVAIASTPEPSTLQYFLIAAICGGGLYFASRKRSMNTPAV